MSFMRSVVGALRARPSFVLGVELADAAARQLVTVPFQRGFPIRYQAATFVEVHDDLP